MQIKKTEVTVGVFVSIAFIAIIVLALKVSNMSGMSYGSSYSIRANFDNIGGLKVKAPVSIAGVKVGEVRSIKLNMADYRALVVIAIDSNILPMQKYNSEGEAIYKESGYPEECEFDLLNCATPFFEDASASILTSGLLGEQYIGLNTGGGSMVLLKHNETVNITQSAIGLEQIIGHVLFNSSDKPEEKKSKDSALGFGSVDKNTAIK